MLSILSLDIAGTPRRWIGVEDAACYYATDKIAWELGDARTRLRGGTNALGVQSEIYVAPIIAVRSPMHATSKLAFEARLSRRMLFARDRNVCAYCGSEFATGALSIDHILPSSRGGADRWMNWATACLACNQRKANRTPEEARMPLLYLPYVPNRHEEFVVNATRRVLADQMAFLLAGVPRHSRLLSSPICRGNGWSSIERSIVNAG